MLPTPMRKAAREITDPAQVWALLDQASLLFLAMSQDDQPYVLPFNFGRVGEVIYLHTGHQGLKIDVLRQNPRVSFSAVAEWSLIPGEPACNWSIHSRSVVGFGRVRFVDDPAEKLAGLTAVTSHYAGPGPHQLGEKQVAACQILAVEVAQLFGKANPAPVAAPPA
ncbi:MAG: pyridoxamine 5'-phosphate oxidase family protein [Deltaproteobacteria bacterium]|nr:pyridoxamine 5'-phosphate oxidase family protein [Deltaproteobacteria bacterium]